MPIMDENDVSLPKATLSKMIKEFMPPELRLAGDATDMLIECCTEFVSLVSSESNEVSTEEKRNTIYPEHVIRALRALGFQEFVPDVTAAWEHWKQGNKCGQRNGGKKSAADAAGLTEEEQIELQQQLFAAARARSFQLPDPPASAPSTSQASGMQPSRTGSSSQGQPSSSTAPAAQPMARTASRTASNATQLAQGQALHPSSSPQASMAMPRLGLPPPSASSGTLSVNHAPSQSASMKAKVLEEGARAMQGSAIVASGSGDATEVPVPVPAGYRLVPQPPQQPQQPVFVVQQPVVEASGQEYRPEQHEVQLDWQQINGQVVMLQDGTLVSLQDLLLHVAQAQAAGTSDAVPEARTAAPAGPPPRQQAVSQPLQQPQTRGQHPLLLTPTVDQPGSQLATLLASVQDKLDRQASGRHQAEARHPEPEARCSNSSSGDLRATSQGAVLVALQQPVDRRAQVTGLQQLMDMGSRGEEVQMVDAAPRVLADSPSPHQRPLVFVPISADGLPASGLTSPRSVGMRVHAPAGDMARGQRSGSPHGGVGADGAGPKDPRRAP